MPSLSPSPAPVEKHEIETMALVLEGRHGIHAAGVAEFLAAVHDQSRDDNRRDAWSQVARTVRRREHLRTFETSTLHRA